MRSIAGGVAEAGEFGEIGKGVCPSPLGFFLDGALKGVRRCLTWKCDCCAKTLGKSVFARLKEATATIRGAIFCTFTVRRLPGATAQKLGAAVSIGWRLWLTKLRQSGVKAAYFRVVEFHKSGVPHLHVLFSERLPQAMLSEKWNQCITRSLAALGVPVEKCGHVWLGNVDAKAVRWGAQKVARYCTKYLTKSLSSWKSGCGFSRRWGASKGFLPASWLFGRRKEGDKMPQEGRWTVRRCDSLSLWGLILQGDGGEAACLDSAMSNVSVGEVDWQTRLGYDFVDGSGGLPGTRVCQRVDKPASCRKRRGYYGTEVLFEIHAEQSDRRKYQRDDPDFQQGTG